MTALTPPPIVADAVTLRPVHGGDGELLYTIYASTRAGELAQVGWDARGGEPDTVAIRYYFESGWMKRILQYVRRLKQKSCVVDCVRFAQPGQQDHGRKQECRPGSRKHWLYGQTAGAPGLDRRSRITRHYIFYRS